jgi:hypothetical protein
MPSTVSSQNSSILEALTNFVQPSSASKISIKTIKSTAHVVSQKLEKAKGNVVVKKTMGIMDDFKKFISQGNSS